MIEPAGLSDGELSDAPRRSLLDRYGLQPDAIYARSFARIDTLLASLALPPPVHQIARRLVHATGEPDLGALLRFHPDAITAGVAALQGRQPIVVDVRMLAVGVRREWQEELGCTLHCAIEQPQAATLAATRCITRSAAAMELLAPLLNGAVVAVGNAPTALLALLDLVDLGAARPALIIGMPVGYVAAVESKDELMQRDLPWITIPGLRGGSPHAAATLNALMRLALDGEAAVPDKHSESTRHWYREAAQETSAPSSLAAPSDLAAPGVLMGLPDAAFVARGPSPSLITKREVRAVALARLGLSRTSVVWDIGTGSGSVGIEAALLAAGGRVYGIDRCVEAVAIANANAKTHGAHTYTACLGEAPEILSGLPQPDAVFLGGSGGRLAAILEAVALRLRPGGRMVVSLATIEHLHTATTVLPACGLNPEVTVLNVARSRPIGALTRLEALNPVYLVCAACDSEANR